MNLNTVLDIIERNAKLVIMWVDGRRTDPHCDTRYFMEEVNLSPVISELSQIELGMMEYGGAIYRELADKLDDKDGAKIGREVVSILKNFKEYSFSMFPDTRFKRYVDEDMTNEDCAKYLYNDATEDDRTNAKTVMLQQWRADCEARYSNFRNHIGSILDEDIMVKATTMLHSKIMQFAVMLDCVLLENHHDLIKMQEEYGLKILNDHNKIHITEYTGMKGYAEKLLSAIGEVEKRKTTIEPQNGRPKGSTLKLFIQNILGDSQKKDRTLKALHNLIDGKKGKGVALVIHAACTANLIIKPTFTQVKNEFGDIGNASGYNRYMRETYVFTDRELDAIRSQF